MKKLFIIALISLLSAATIDAAGVLSPLTQVGKTIVVPPSVTAAFAHQFPNARLKKWEQKKEGYIADFRQAGEKLFAYYSSDGVWKGTETPIKWTKNLPAAVKEGWKNSAYYSWYVVDIKRIETPEQPLYALHVNNGNLLDSDHHDAFLEEYVLFFSEKGELVRKDKMP